MALFDKDGNVNNSNEVFGIKGQGALPNYVTRPNTKVKYKPVTKVNAAPLDVDYEDTTVTKKEFVGPPKPTTSSILKNEDSQVFDAGKGLSMPTDAKVPPAPMTETEKLIAANEKQYTNWANAQKAIAVSNFVIDIVNADSAYQAAKGQAQINIMLARNQASDAIYRGRQAQLDSQSEGYNAGQDALLALAAQGQDVSGAGAQKVQGSYEAMGYEMGAREMLNAYREALGYRLEEEAYNYQVAQAGTNSRNAVSGSMLNTAVQLAVL